MVEKCWIEYNTAFILDFPIHVVTSPDSSCLCPIHLIANLGCSFITLRLSRTVASLQIRKLLAQAHRDHPTCVCIVGFICHESPRSDSARG